MVRETLQYVGLSPEEIETYLFLLRQKGASAAQVAKYLNQARSTTYRFLASLEHKGLISNAITRNTTQYYATSPERLAEKIEEQANAVRDILPELEKISGVNDPETSVELYRSTEGIKTIMRDILRTEQPYTLLGEAERFFEIIPIFSEQWIHEMNRRGTKGRLLCPEEQHYHITEHEEIKFIPKKLAGDITTWTYGDKTAQFIWSHPLHAVVIHSRSVAKSAEQVFEHLWGNATLPSTDQLQKFRNTKS